jgi:hypothetical protein
MNPEITSMPIDIELEMANWFVFTVLGTVLLLWLVSLRVKSGVKPIEDLTGMTSSPSESPMPSQARQFIA